MLGDLIPRPVLVVGWSLTILGACSGDDPIGSDGGSGTSPASTSDADTTSAATEGSTASGDAASSDEPQESSVAEDTATPSTGLEGTSTTSDTTSDDVTGSDVRFDLGSFPDLPPPQEEIPSTCALAEQSETTIGCLFFPVDLDQQGEGMADPEIAQYAVVASNVQLDSVANVTVERKVDGVWNVVEGPVAVGPRDLHVFELPDHHQDASGILPGGAYRLTSDVPVAAYQFNPWVAAAATSDASLLYPVASWDTQAHVVQWVTPAYRAYLTIVAATDGTVVTVQPPVETLEGPGVSAGGPAIPITIELDEGDIAEVMAPAGSSISGTTLESTAPIGVFSGHECANIPAGVGGCDHLEEQLSGLRLWGTQFVASRVTARSEPPEASAWHIYASEDDTELTFEADAGVTGLPDGPVVLQRGELLELFVAGPSEHPGDFLVTASKPAMLVNYMIGIPFTEESMDGDPAMVQMSPVEQFLSRYVLLVPSLWEQDYLVITRPTGATVNLDGIALLDDVFSTVGANYEVARVLVEDGIHALDGDEPFGVVVVGYDFANSYAYLGGAGTVRINPVPEG